MKEGSEMKQIDKCSSCKHLTAKTHQYSAVKCGNVQYVCEKLYEFMDVDMDDSNIIISRPNKFKCIAWEAKNDSK